MKVSEALRVLVDPFSMESHEQNVFLDLLYSQGHIAALLGHLRERARVTLGGGQHDVAARETASCEGAPGEMIARMGPIVFQLECLLDLLAS